MTTKTKTTGAKPHPYVYSHITKIPDVCGGKATIDGRRVRVMDVVSFYLDGSQPEEILRHYDFLNLAQVYAALAYYFDGNQQEIENGFEADRRWEEELVRESREWREGERSKEIGPVAKAVLVKRDRE